MQPPHDDTRTVEAKAIRARISPFLYRNNKAQEKKFFLLPLLFFIFFLPFALADLIH
jgi:hypothetical protein